MKYTGERIIPNDGELYSLYKRHLSLYEFAARHAKDRVVLDIGSGEGYGPDLLAETAKEVIAIDNSPEAVEHAMRTYKRDNLEFLLMDAVHMEFGQDSFDLVVAIESIEHVTDHRKFLDNVCRVLRKSGLFIVSTPHVRTPSPDRRPENHFHYKEFTLSDFSETLKEYYELIEIMGIKVNGTALKDILKKIDVFRIRRLLTPGIRERIHRKTDRNMACEIGNPHVEKSLNLVGVCSVPKKRGGT